MTRLRRTLKNIVYLPTLPVFFKPLVWSLRRVGWLRGSSQSTRRTRRALVALPYNSLGDLVLSVRFLEHLHHLFPTIAIDAVVGSRMTAIFQQLPFLNRAIGYEPSSSAPPFARYRDIVRLIQLVRKEKLAGVYDLALDPRWDSDGHGYLARALVYLSGAKTRVAYSGRVDSIDPSLDGFLTHAAQDGEGEHELLRKTRLLVRSGITSKDIEPNLVAQTSPSLIALAEQLNIHRLKLLEERGMNPGERYGVLSPAATNPRRIWPLEHVAATVRALHRLHGLRFVVIGSSADAAMADRLAVLVPEAVVSVAGQTDIPLMAALLLSADIFIGNDSGPAHLSGILGTDTVVISPFPLSSNAEHVNSPRRFSPCGPRVRVVQPEHPLSPCQNACTMQEAHCIRQISTTEVIATCEELLQSRAERL